MFSELFLHYFNYCLGLYLLCHENGDGVLMVSSSRALRALMKEGVICKSIMLAALTRLLHATGSGIVYVPKCDTTRHAIINLTLLSFSRT